MTYEVIEGNYIVTYSDYATVPIKYEPLPSDAMATTQFCIKE